MRGKLGASVPFPAGEGTVGVGRDGGGTSVTDVSNSVGSGVTASKLGAASGTEARFAVARSAVLAAPLTLGGVPSTVAGAGVTFVSVVLVAGPPFKRALGGGGRKLGAVEGAGGCGRMLGGGGGRESPRTGGGGGVPEGRAAAGTMPAAGRGGSDTGRGGSATGRTAGGGADAELSLGVPAMFSLSLALPCSSPMRNLERGRKHTPL